MDHRIPLKCHTVLPFEGLTCHVVEVVGQGSNAIVYKGWYSDGLNRDLRHKVLIKELYPFHPKQMIYRQADNSIFVEAEAEKFFNTHRASFEAGNRIHLRLLADHPERMAMGGNVNSFAYNGTLYTVLGFSNGRTLQTELDSTGGELRSVAQRMLKLLDALEAFHKSGFLHLDISPDNIMLTGREDAEQIFLIDYNSARELGARETAYLSCKAGYSAPEVSRGDLSRIGFPSDLYSVAAVFFRSIMGRTLTLQESLQPKAPDGSDSPLLRSAPETAANMVRWILRKGLHTLPGKRYQSIGAMRQAFQELLDRIDCVGVTHWALWENGKRSIEELIRFNPSLQYLKEESSLYPIRLEHSMSLSDYLEEVLSGTGHSGLILAEGGMGKTTLLMHTAAAAGGRYSPTAPAIFYISLNGWNGTSGRYIRDQILMRLRFKPGENSYESAMHALQKLLEQPLVTKMGKAPCILLLLDGLNEIRGDMAPLVQEIHALSALAGVRILAASRSEVPSLALEPIKLMRLNAEDVQEALSKKGMLIPEDETVQYLLQTPLILSMYLQAAEAGKQLEIRNEQDLIRQYMDALLEKEKRQLPEGSPVYWQTDAALNCVLPVIAAQLHQAGHPLTSQEVLKAVEKCWSILHHRYARRMFPQWIGHSRDIFGDARTAEEWYGIVIHDLLWQRLGMLVKDQTDQYLVFHQTVGSYLAEHSVKLPRDRIWLPAAAAVMLCIVLLAGYQGWQQERQLLQNETDQHMREAMELGTVGYAEYGTLYRQMRELIDRAKEQIPRPFGDRETAVIAQLEKEAQLTGSEQSERKRMEQSAAYDQQKVSWSSSVFPFQYSLLQQLQQYPDERSAFYLQAFSALEVWCENEDLRECVPEYPEVLDSLLEADAGYISEMYHTAVAVHLPEGESIWKDSIYELVALIPELELHRANEQMESREQYLYSLKQKMSAAERAYYECWGKLEQYLKRTS